MQKWEAGTKRPSGMALKLLAVVEKHGLKVLVSAPDRHADGRTPDQHDAFAVASWLSEADRSGQLVRFVQPNLTLPVLHASIPTAISPQERCNP